ncbi:MAG: ParB/RepB/Spo0J family partition protein [Coriobacteriia bacterium]
MARKSGLGKGLGALIPGAGEGAAQEAGPQELPISEIQPNPEQPRTVMDESSIDELAQSILKVGVLQPILVRQHGDGYQIVAGERRWRAAKAAGLQTVPVRVVASDAAESLEIALIENLQREDLNPIEEALGYRKLLTEYQMTQAELADKVAKSRSTITNALRLLDLAEEIQAMISRGELSAGHARAILSVTDEEKRLELAKRVVSQGLSVRETENLARLLAAGQTERAKRPATPKAFKAVARSLRNMLGTNVRVKQTAKKGKIEIDFHGEEELERIFRLLTGGEGAGEEA